MPLFKGGVEIFSIDALYSLGRKAGKHGKGGEPDPCPGFVSVGNTNGSNGSGGNGGGSGSGGGGTGWSGSNHGAAPSRVIVRLSGGRGSVEVGVGVFYMPSDTKKSASARSGGDCPEDELLVPVNEGYELVYNKLKDKSDCVYQKLKSKNGDLFKKTIGKFVKDPKYNLVLQNGDCKNTNTACTNGNSISTTGNVYITIEDNTARDFDMAATILHEAIHAELWRYVAQYKDGINPNDKKNVFKYYKYYAETYGDVFNNNENNAKNAIDHIYMTQHYINPIALALRQLDNNKYPLDYYKSYAWDGLRAWDPNNTLGAQEDSKYYKYRAIVNANSKLCK